MDDRQVREMLMSMATNLDADAEYELRHEEFVADMPQSGERIRGRDNMRALQRAFPPDRLPTLSGAADHGRRRRLDGRGCRGLRR
jgi:hypothetical protein